MFYELELNIKGHKTLHESISEFLKEEKLDGVNKYSCNYCNEKQEATRFISLKKLPLVLNLQLMRFIYDRYVYLLLLLLLYCNIIMIIIIIF